ncbi:MAG TPA: DUF4397 domain-containing protein [Gemmatimonadaceae bacterium]
MKKLTSIAVLLAASMLAGCFDKNAVADITGPATGARIKFFNFGVSSPSVNFYANDTKVTGITSGTGVESNSGVAYGGVGAGGYYSAIPGGSYTFNGRITAVTDNGLQVMKLTSTIETGKAYSFYMSGIYDATAKSVEGFVVEDPLPATIDWTQATVRFVNAVSNSQPMILYAKNQTTGVETAIGGVVAYKGAGVFTPMGVLATGVASTYDLSTRLAGSSTNIMTRTGMTFSAGRTYTIAARGNITVTSTQLLDNTANR